MFQNPTDGVEGRIRNAGIAVASKSGLAIFPDAQVGVHAGSVVLEQGLGHESHGVTVAGRHVFQDVFEPHQLVAHFQERLKAHVDFGLPRGGHLVVLAFDGDADLFQNQEHFGTQVLEFVHGRYGEIPLLVAGFVSQVGRFVPSGVPDPLDRVDLIESPVT